MMVWVGLDPTRSCSGSRAPVGASAAGVAARARVWDARVGTRPSFRVRSVVRAAAAGRSAGTG